MILISLRNRAKLDAARTQARYRRGKFNIYVIDIAEQDACEAFVLQVAAAHGGVDFLINNAG